MANNVNRFMRNPFRFILFLLVLSISPVLVKQTLAASSYDRVLGFPDLQSLELERTGPVVLSGIWREPSLNLRTVLQIDQRVRLGAQSQKPDRKGRFKVRLHRKNGDWINGELVRNGWARVYPDPDFDDRLRDLYLLENLARLEKKGHWSDGTFQQESALNENMKTDRFAVVSGLIVEVGEFKDKTYFNFGANWRTDFTILLEKKNSNFFREFGFWPSILKGKNVQIRGWIHDQNGPMIKLDHPHQLQLLN